MLPIKIGILISEDESNHGSYEHHLTAKVKIKPCMRIEPTFSAKRAVVSLPTDPLQAN